MAALGGAKASPSCLQAKPWSLDERLGGLLEGHIKKDNQPLAVAPTTKENLEFPVDLTCMTVGGNLSAASLRRRHFEKTRTVLTAINEMNNAIAPFSAFNACFVLHSGLSVSAGVQSSLQGQ